MTTRPLSELLADPRLNSDFKLVLMDMRDQAALTLGHGPDWDPPVPVPDPPPAGDT